jgi:hypothetical protein
LSEGLKHSHVALATGQTVIKLEMNYGQQVVTNINKGVFHLKITPLLKNYWTSNKSSRNATTHTCIISKGEKKNVWNV